MIKTETVKRSNTERSTKREIVRDRERERKSLAK